MDTLIVLKDTITVNVVKLIDSTKPCIQEASTNFDGVEIAGIICGAIVLIAIIFYCCLKTKYKYLKTINNQKDEFEKEKENRADARKKVGYEHEIAKANIQKAENIEKEKTKSEYQKASEFFDQLCNSVKDKDGKIDIDVLKLLLDFFCNNCKKTNYTEEKDA